MTLLDALLPWVSLLEEQYGVSAKPVGATPADISRYEEHLQLDITGEFKELLEFSDGLFVEQRANLLPGISLWPLKDLFAVRPQRAVRGLNEWDELEIKYTTTAPCTLDDLAFIAAGYADLGVVCGGPADGAVWAVDPGAPLFDSKPGRPVHPQLEMGWSIMPYEQHYDGKSPIGAWRWDS